MKSVHCSLDGSLFCVPVEFICIRWGGGALPGKTHVVLSGCSIEFSGDYITDDFGNLVKVS